MMNGSGRRHTLYDLTQRRLIVVVTAAQRSAKWVGKGRSEEGWVGRGRVIDVGKRRDKTLYCDIIYRHHVIQNLFFRSIAGNMHLFPSNPAVAAAGTVDSQQRCMLTYISIPRWH